MEDPPVVPPSARRARSGFSICDEKLLFQLHSEMMQAEKPKKKRKAENGTATSTRSAPTSSDDTNNPAPVRRPTAPSSLKKLSTSVEYKDFQEKMSNHLTAWAVRNVIYFFTLSSHATFYGTLHSPFHVSHTHVHRNHLYRSVDCP